MYYLKDKKMSVVGKAMKGQKSCSTVDDKPEKAEAKKSQSKNEFALWHIIVQNVVH